MLQKRNQRGGRRRSSGFGLTPSAAFESCTWRCQGCGRSTLRGSATTQQGGDQGERAYIQPSMKKLHNANAMTGPTRGAFDTAIIALNAKDRLMFLVAQNYLAWKRTKDSIPRAYPPPTLYIPASSGTRASSSFERTRALTSNRYRVSDTARHGIKLTSHIYSGKLPVPSCIHLSTCKIRSHLNYTSDHTRPHSAPLDKSPCRSPLKSLPISPHVERGESPLWIRKALAVHAFSPSSHVNTLRVTPMRCCSPQTLDMGPGIGGVQAVA